MADLDISKLTISKVVDARGSACPGPLLEAKKAIGAVAKGEIIEVLSGDASTKNDLPLWAQKVGHEFLGVIEADGYSRLFMKRGR
ncbi:sulfurtransferase TusA family protein [bacterium]|nr:sulfurtransferase TusA family protein [bacterium]